MEKTMPEAELPEITTAIIEPEVSTAHLPVDLDRAVERFASAPVDAATAEVIGQLKEGAVFYFVGYELVDASMTLHFLCPDPGPNLGATYQITVPDTDIDGIADEKSFAAYASGKLAELLRPPPSKNATKLDGFLKSQLVV